MLLFARNDFKSDYTTVAIEAGEIYNKSTVRASSISVAAKDSCCAICFGKALLGIVVLSASPLSSPTEQLTTRDAH